MPTSQCQLPEQRCGLLVLPGPVPVGKVSNDEAERRFSEVLERAARNMDYDVRGALVGKEELLREGLYVLRLYVQLDLPGSGDAGPGVTDTGQEHPRVCAQVAKVSASDVEALSHGPAR